MAFGKFGAFPLRFGGGQSIKQQELQAFLEALRPGFTDSSESANYAECVAMAIAVATVWACNKRLTNQAIPSRMLEQLAVWEEALRLRPAPEDSDVARRRAVAARFRGNGDNSAGGVFDALTLILGQNLEDVFYVQDADEITYWPGVNPGPPGFEWASNRAHVCVRMNKNALGNASFESKRDAAVQLLDALLPAYARFSIGTGDGFTFGTSILGETFF